MKNILIAIGVLFFALPITAMPVQTSARKTEVVQKQKRTFAERIAHKILKKKIKRAHKKNNMTNIDRQAIISPVLGVVSILAWMASIYASFGLSVAGVVIALIIGVGAGIAALILGRRALKRIDSDPALSGRGLAILGMVLGGLGLLIILANGILALANS